ncbi:ribosomal protein L30 [Biscogniauxia mediterranea]|nr:ribosomal protein L30 [Biscogniauxia mediterranea]
MAFFRITLHRSAIGLPQRTRGVLAALGLRRRCQTVFHPVSAQVAGMLLKVKELVRVEEAETAMTTRQMRDARKPERGFWVESVGGVGASAGVSRLGCRCIHHTKPKTVS